MGRILVFVLCLVGCVFGAELAITSINANQKEIVVKFNRNAKFSDVELFENNGDTYQKIYNIKAKLQTKELDLKESICDFVEVRGVGNRTRIVFVNKDMVELKGYINGRTMRFAKQEAKAKQVVVVVDAGHGGKDGGTVGHGFVEKGITLGVALKVGERLEKLGHKVLYTRTKDKFVTLDERAKFANAKRADLFLSIHVNAVGREERASVVSGVQTYFLSRSDSARSVNAVNLENKDHVSGLNKFTRSNFFSSFNREKILASNKLAIDVQLQILERMAAFREFETVDGGVREGPFFVLAGVNMPAVLIEMGYITHEEEAKFLMNEKYRNFLADGIANGVEQYIKKNM